MSRGPWCFRPFELDQDVCDYLASSVHFLNPRERHLEGFGFTKCCDYPHLPDHSYYEGYMHGKPCEEPVPSLNPRTGMMVQKPAAPRPLRAFLCAFREANAPALRAAVAHPLLSIFSADDLFADVAVQVHWGEAVPASDVCWHRDSVNSLLHLNLTFNGQRGLHHEPVLHGRPCSTPEEERARQESVGTWTFDAAEVERMRARSGYLTSPYAFFHGLEFPAASWADRSIALQARILLTCEQHRQLCCARATLPQVMETLTTTLAGMHLAVPALTDVHRWERVLDELACEGDVAVVPLDTVVEAAGAAAGERPGVRSGASAPGWCGVM